MKHAGRKFKSMALCLKELEPYVRNPIQLKSGKPFPNFHDMRPRELLGNWLLCAALNHAHQAERFGVGSDPTGGDGLLCDSVEQDGVPTEHVYIPNMPNREAGDTELQILEQIKLKNDRGPTYANGKVLVVFVDSGGGRWFPNRVARLLPVPFHFREVWAMSLQSAEDGEYLYGVVQLNLDEGDAPTWLIHIRADFQSWQIIQSQ